MGVRGDPDGPGRRDVGVRRRHARRASSDRRRLRGRRAAVHRRGPGRDLRVGQSAATKPTVEVTENDRLGQAPAGNHVLSGTYQVPSGAWGGFSHNLATPQDWSGYGGLRFWWYASQDSRPASPTAGADIVVELKDDGADGEHAELWKATFKDNWSADGSRWKLVELPFSAFTWRGDYQPGPVGIQDQVLTLSRSWGYALTMPTDTPPTGYAIDDVQVYGSPEVPTAATVAATPSIVLVDAGQTAEVVLALTTSDGEPLASDVTVAYTRARAGPPWSVRTTPPSAGP
ncbi:carbohydrate binding domain-containing protein [Oerskovia sp. M15]